MKVAEVLVGKLLENLVAIKVDRIPELWLAMVQVIDRVQVHVFFMPSKQ